MLDEKETKSSTEILSELFGAFNAEPPAVLSDAKLKKSRKKSKKIKKQKKKLKSKKHKKRKPSTGSDDNSTDNSDYKEVCLEKKPKIEVCAELVPQALDKLLENIVRSSPRISESHLLPEDIPVPSPNVQINIKTEPDFPTFSLHTTFKNEPIDVPKSDSQLGKDEKEKLQSVFGDPTSNENSIMKKNKMLILPSLKNSAVFQETLRAVEEKRKEAEAKHAKYEEGELINTSESSDDDSKLDLKEKKVRDIKRGSKHRRKRSHSPSHRHDRKRHRRSRSRSRQKSRSRRATSRDRYNNRFRDRGSSSRSSHSRLSSHHRGSSRERPAPRDKRRSESKERRHDRTSPQISIQRDKIDKKRLLAIAKKNAVKLAASGIVPAENLNAITRGGKTVNELTEYCKKLSKKEAGEDISEDEILTSDSDDLSFHHPFQVRDRPNSIVMNIKNAISLPTRSFQEKAAEQSKVLRLQFPVSSGSTHRANESEWTPVEPETIPIPIPKQGKMSGPPPTAMLPPPPPPPSMLQLPPLPTLPTLSAVPPPLPPAPVFPVIQPNLPADDETGGPDISAIVSKRLDALRALQENPQNSQAKARVSRTERQLDQWAKIESRKARPTQQETGEFTGSTGVRVLTPQQLSSGTQAWAKKDQLIRANPVTGGMGMALLQKMGWQPGEGLGKNKEGSLEPLKLEIKTDKKGLVALDESSWGSKTPHHVGPLLPTVKTLDGKHPVSLLNEFAARRKWGAPRFELAFECGPDHKKNFLFKVVVDGKEYQPTVASINKKQAKAECAALCLRALGVISAEAPVP